MQDEARKQGLALAVVALAATVAMLSLLWPSPKAPRERDEARRSVPARSAPVDRDSQTAASAPAKGGIVQGAEPGAERSGAERSPRDRQAVGLRRGASRHARRFLAAFLRYDVGDRSGRVRREIRRTVEPGFARLLLGEQPSAPSGTRAPGRQRLVRLTGKVTRDGRAVAVRARVARGRRLSFVWIKVEQRQGRWLVTALN